MFVFRQVANVWNVCAVMVCGQKYTRFKIIQSCNRCLVGITYKSTCISCSSCCWKNVGFIESNAVPKSTLNIVPHQQPFTLYTDANCLTVGLLLLPNAARTAPKNNSIWWSWLILYVRKYFNGALAAATYCVYIARTESIKHNRPTKRVLRFERYISEALRSLPVRPSVKK